MVHGHIFGARYLTFINDQRFTLTMLPPYWLFLNPTEQAHSAFKSHVKNALVQPQLQVELLDKDGRRHEDGLTLQAWRLNILVRVAENALGSITAGKCQNWCGRVLRYIALCQNGRVFD